MSSKPEELYPGWLVLGLAALPIFFGVALLRPGYSTRARIFIGCWALIWLFAVVIPKGDPVPGTSQAPVSASIPKPAPTPEPVAAEPKSSVRTWQTEVNGHIVVCAADGNAVSYTVMPDEEEFRHGIMPRYFEAPSYEDFEATCSHRGTVP